MCMHIYAHALDCSTLTMLQYTVPQFTLCFVTAVHANRAQCRQGEQQDADDPRLMTILNKHYYAMCLYTMCTIENIFNVK